MTTLKMMRMTKMTMMRMVMRMMESETLVWVVKSFAFAGLGRQCKVVYNSWLSQVKSSLRC